MSGLLGEEESEGEMTDYSWLPYWIVAVAALAFGFWLRGLYEATKHGDITHFTPDERILPQKDRIGDHNYSDDEAWYYAKLYDSLVREFDRKT